MLSTRDIRRRIRSISSTAQITRAMQMVAASKMRRAQQAAINFRPFSKLVYNIQRRATTQIVDFTHPLLEVRDVKRRAVILVSGDKGLCGPLNANLFRLAMAFNPETTLFITAGKKAAQFIARSGRKLHAEFNYDDTPKFADARAIAGSACDLFLNKEVDEVKITSTRFINTLSQVPMSIEFLPIGALKSLPELPGIQKEDELAAHSMEATFEPSAEEVLSYLLPRYLNIVMYQVLLGAKASEQSARMVSMKNATDSANNLISDLTLEYNKLRQGNITTELLDIAGGQSNAR